MNKQVSQKRIAFLIVVAIIFVALFAGITATGAVSYAASNREVTTRVTHISDIHIMTQNYSNIYSAKFASDAGSSKLLAQTEAALETTLDEIYEMEDAPTVALISGDLTSNAEVEAHRYVAKRLGEFTAKMRARGGEYEDFQIFIIPGNHDMYNDRAVSYLPSEEEFAACNSDQEKLALLQNYQKRSVASATSKDIFEIYSDFGYCNCDGRKEGVHTGNCKIAQGTKLTFFYESEFWFDDETTRVNQPDGTIKYEGFDVRPATEKEMADYENNGKDFEYLADAGRIGLCSYTATINGVTIVGVDGNAREYTGETDTIAKQTSMGWNETTGGLTTNTQLRWIVDETKEEVESDNLVILNCHYNNIAHFVSQDEVISLFVLDNLDRYTSTLADAGIRYQFSGHQHANDIVSSTSQKGNVMYDIETGSTVSYGSGYRIVDFTQKWENGNYYEDVKSTMHSLDKNANGDAFYYGAYKLTSELSSSDVVLSQNEINSDMFSTEEPTIFGGEMTLVKQHLTNSDGEKVGVGDYLAEQLGSMVDNLVGGFVNDGLYDMLSGLVGGIKGMFPFAGTLVEDLIDGLSEFDLYGFVDNGDGTFSLTDTPKAGNDLVTFVEDLVDWLFAYDFTYGKVAGGATISEILVEVYGAHLSGASTAELPEKVVPLIEKLTDGTFVDFLVTTLVNALVPQLDLIFNAPIRFDATTNELADGKGFDITNAMTQSDLIKVILTGKVFEVTDDAGHSSLKLVVSEIAPIAKSLLASVSSLGLFDLGSIGGIVDTVLEYVNKYLEVGSLGEVLQTELIDKYVTDAFCRNLGSYGAYIVSGIATDTCPDGSRWDTTRNRYKEYAVINEANFVVKSYALDANEKYGDHSFVRKQGEDGSLTVTPSVENGLLASMISVSFDTDIATTKKIQWHTSIDAEVFDKNASGDYAFSIPASYIKYSTSEDLSNATTIKANTVNVDRELPTIDLGILYLNMSHRYKLYNQHTVKLSGLEAGTTYYYSLGNDDYGWSEVYSFNTASEGALRFLAITDVQGSIQKNYQESLPALEMAVEHFGEDDIAFIASMGDNVDNGKNIKQMTWWLDEQSSVMANNTFVSAVGNHEDEGYALSSVLALPDGATINETGYYYSYDYNFAHFIVLDTNDLENDQLSSAQTEWLLADLEETNANENIKWTVVMLHKGPYTAGSHAFDSDVIALRAQLTPIFADNGVDVVLQGHDHTYSVSQFIGRDGLPVDDKKAGKAYNFPEGVLYINLGTMGDKYYDYIYSDAVSLMQRKKVDSKLSKYFVDGKLELTETPVFADIKVEEEKFTIATYTVIDGEKVLVDEIIIGEGGIDWSDLTVDQLAAIISVAVALAVIIVLIVLLSVSNKRRKQWTE